MDIRFEDARVCAILMYLVKSLVEALDEFFLCGDVGLLGDDQKAWLEVKQSQLQKEEKRNDGGGVLRVCMYKYLRLLYIRTLC